MKNNDQENENKLSEATRSFINFSIEIDQFEMLLSFMQVGDSFINENINDAKRRFVSLSESYLGEANLIKLNPERFLDMNYYESHLSRMMYIRAIDNFITYFKDILGEIVIKKPQVLKSQDSERLDFILEHDNMESLLKSISEKKIEELFYKGLSDIEKYFQTRLGIKLFSDNQRAAEINLLIKQRNLAVHNRGKISKSFLKEFPDQDYVEGFSLAFKFEYVQRVNDALVTIVNDLDYELSNKFKLDQVSY